MAEMLHSNNTLQYLDISENPLGCKGVTYIAKALESNRTLNYLCIAETDCSDNKTSRVLEVCNLRLPFLPRINKVGKDGAVALAGALRVNNSLKELHLRDNDITDEGFKCLAEALLENTALEELCVKYPGDGLAALDQDTRERVEERITWDCRCTYIESFRPERLGAYM